MYHIVNTCPLTKLEGGLNRLLEADDDAVIWLESTVCPKKSEPLNILQQQPQICSDFNKILHTQDDFCYKHYYIVSYKSALTLLNYESLNNVTHMS